MRGVRLSPPRFIPSVPGKRLRPMKRSELYVELKLDGFRALAEISGGKCTFYSKRGKLLVGFDSLARRVAAVLGVHGALVLDGEIAALDSQGRSVLARVRRRAEPLTYCIFDFLWANGEDVRHLPLSERKRLLRLIVPRSGKSVQLVSPISGDPIAIARNALRAGHEGIVLKEKSSRYLVGPRTGNWIKVKRPVSK